MAVFLMHWICMIGNDFILAIYTSNKVSMMILQSFLLLIHKAVLKVKYKN